VARACAAGRSCGGCHPVIDKIIDAETRRATAPDLSRVGELAATG
jgi:NAD(P)H-nitrite reductase large subunit